MKAEIISIGDELLIGQVINTNQAFLAERLNSIGIPVTRMSTVGDTEEAILKAFDSAWTSHELVVVTGGLGPTHDDITRSAVCKFFKTDLVLNEKALENIKRLFAARGIELIRINEDQSMVPRACTVLQNREGTAPGFLFDQGKVMVVMPGVPYEMQGIMKEDVIPYLRKKGTGSVILHRTLRTTGIAESLLARTIGDVNTLFAPDSGVSLAFLPSPMGVRLRITVQAPDSEKAEMTVRNIEQKLRQKAEKYIYGDENEELEETIGRILAQRNLTIAVAESCTGGLIADRITNVPGSSRYFERGVIVYSNRSKIDELEVPESLLQDHGAVSREVAEAMASGVMKKSGTDIGVSTTGIAGPTGGTPEKPIGLIWVGYSDKNGTLALRFNFGNDRRRFKERASQAVLELVRKKLLKID